MSGVPEGYRSLGPLYVKAGVKEAFQKLCKEKKMHMEDRIREIVIADIRVSDPGFDPDA